MDICGGAGDAGLACYDEYSLSAVIAGTPLPVITGIGHATNETVVEYYIAYKNCITPTAAASFILERFDEQVILFNNQLVLFNKAAAAFLSVKRQSISTTSEKFSSGFVANKMNVNKYILKNLHAGLPAYTSSFINIHKQSISNSFSALKNFTRPGNIKFLFETLSRQFSRNKKQSELLFLNRHRSLSDQSSKLSSLHMHLKNNNDLISHLEEK